METHIPLPADLKERLEHAANMRGMSLHEFVRQSLESAIAQKTAEDPLFADTAVFHDDGPDDLASNHDDYLYGDAS